MKFAFSAETPFVLVNGAKEGFHCPKCPPRFAADPEKYLTQAGNCPVGGHAAKVSRATRIVVNNALYYACCADCRPQLAKDPSNQVRHPVQVTFRTGILAVAIQSRECPGGGPGSGLIGRD
jgi:hypothetical protein